MDSRIREIEQWLAEAKQDLGECGREAYIRKLFLLDAEIRSVIKENGAVPETGSPRSQAKRVRRLGSPALVLGAMGVTLLTATAFFMQSGFHPRVTPLQPPPQRSLAGSVPAESGPALQAFIPDSIPGEEILPDGWRPEETAPAAGASGMPSMEEPVRETGVPEAGAILASAPAKPAPAQPGAKPAAAPATKRAALTGATDVLILASNGSATRSPVRPANRSTGGASISSGSFAGGKEVGSLSVTHNFNWFPESENQPTQVNQTKQAANKLVGGKREGQANEIVPVDPENPVEHASDKAKKKSSDKLDPDELKAKLEKRFNQ